MRREGKELEFISYISRDGSGTIVIGTEDAEGEHPKIDDMSYVDDEVFNLNALSLSRGTYIASGFNSFVVKLKKEKPYINPEVKTIKREKSDRIKSLFETYFDGCYDVEPQVQDNPSTFRMGVCKLEYAEDTDTLMVHLRRPGFLIGRAGRTINGLKEWLGCEIKITEVKKF